MPRNRPTSVMVFAVFHFIIGGLGLVCGLCGVGGQILGKTTGGFANFQPNAQQQELQAKIEKATREKLPSNDLIQFVDAGMGVVLSVLLLVGGVGLINMQPYGRTTSLVYAVLSITVKLIAIVYSFVFVVPVMKEMMQELGAKAATPQEAQVMQIAAAAASFTPLFQILFLIYPTAVLIFMLLPSTARAFRGEAAPGPRVEESIQEEGEWGYRDGR